MMRRTVHQVDGSVETCRAEMHAGRCVISRASVRARTKDERQPADMPNTSLPRRIRVMPLPVAVTTPAQSLPGSSLGPGYSSSTSSTSRKLRPIALTCISISPSAQVGEAKAVCSRSSIPATAPRYARCAAPRVGRAHGPWRAPGSHAAGFVPLAR